MPTTIKIGNWYVYPDNNKLRFDDTDFFIEPLAMDVLVFFAEHPDEVVSRDRLIDAVWKGRVVGDHAVYRIINKLRQTLAKDTTQEYIKTIRKKGYQLVCTVEHQLRQPKQERSNSQELLLESFNTELTEHEQELTLSAASNTNRKTKALKLKWSKAIKWAVAVVVLMVISVFAVKFYFYHSMTSFYRATPLITLEGTIRDPSFSPNGNYVAFSYQEKTGGSWDIYVESLIDGRMYQITDDLTDELSPTWLPNGQQLALIRYDNQRCLIDVVNVPVVDDFAQASNFSEGTLTQCSGVLQHNDLAWSGDDKHVFYTSAETKVSPLQVFRLTIQTGKTEQLTNYTQGESRGALSIKLSPDNQRLAIQRDVNWRDSHIDVMELGTLASETERKLVGWNRYFDWSNDGRSLIYNRNSKEIDAYDLSMKIEKNIAKSVDAITFPTYSPVNKELVVVTGRKVVDIVAEALGRELDESQKALTVISSSSIDNYAEYANTSDRIAFVSRRTGEAQVWLKSTDGRERQLTQFESNFDIRRLRWSPSDQALLFMHNRTLYVLNIEDKEPLLTAVYEARAGESVEGESWTADGKQVLFSSDRDGDWQIYRTPLSGTAEVERLTQKGGYGAFESPEQQGIFYLKYHAKGLWYQRYDSKQEVLVVDNIDVFSSNSIYLREGDLYYLSDEFPKMAIYRYDLQTQKREFIQRYYGSPWLISISHQADKLLYQRNTQAQSSLVRLKP